MFNVRNNNISDVLLLLGRSILVCSTTANELIHSATRRKEKLLVLKLDFQKALDSVDWEYLILLCMDFPQKWIQWISSCCLSTGTTSVLVNGSLVDSIMLRRGVRQGDPISPYLFLIARGGTFGCGINFGCKIDSFPIRYMGFPLSNKKLYVGAWDALVERLVLIKSVLFSVPVYFMSLFNMLGSVQKQLESYMIRFLWKGLGIYNLKVRNQSLLFKWVWKVRINNRESLRHSVISSCSLIVD
ncbi:uncharacterized protein LOC126681992 [Mercurialis annua]|uniref:uncharacterized protein LOC126681992 n=1 Tax=Mercurialis annua TaxID=3986 RepID=UPI00215F7CEB|nr:uncharacterized protein LOC126681992 [Mercurialis annua]